MRLLPYHLLIAVCLFFQQSPEAKLFPLPADMEYTFPGAKLNDSDAKLLEKAFAADFAKQDYCDKKPALGQLATADISLGKLGSGVIVKGNDICLCGGTGQCAMYFYVREENGYRPVCEGFGWAFAFVDSNTEVPDLVFAHSGGGGLMTLILLRYDGRVYVKRGCDKLTAKEGFPQSPEDWWDSSKVLVSPCDKNLPNSRSDTH